MRKQLVQKQTQVRQALRNKQEKRFHEETQRRQQRYKKRLARPV